MPVASESRIAFGGCSTSRALRFAHTIAGGSSTLSSAGSHPHGNSAASCTSSATARMFSDVTMRGSCQNTAPQFTCDASALVATPLR